MARGEAQVLRLSAIYAALDRSELIRLPHLRAAYDVWTYCYVSATRLFGMSTGDPIADRIREAVHASSNGLTKTQIQRLFFGHVDADRMNADLHQLAALGALASYTVASRGRSSSRWATLEAN